MTGVPCSKYFISRLGSYWLPQNWNMPKNSCPELLEQYVQGFHVILVQLAIGISSIW